MNICIEAKIQLNNRELDMSKELIREFVERNKHVIQIELIPDIVRLVAPDGMFHGVDFIGMRVNAQAVGKAGITALIALLETPLEKLRIDTPNEQHEARQLATIADELKRLAAVSKVGSNEIEIINKPPNRAEVTVGRLEPIVPGFTSKLGIDPAPEPPIDANMLAEAEKLVHAGYVFGREQNVIENVRDKDAKVYRLTPKQDHAFYAALVNVSCDAKGMPLAYAGTNPQNLGQRIRSARCAATVPIEYLSNCLGIPTAEVAAIEHNKKKPTDEQLAIIARLFGIDVKKLIDG